MYCSRIINKILGSTLYILLMYCKSDTILGKLRMNCFLSLLLNSILENIICKQLLKCMLHIHTFEQYTWHIESLLLSKKNLLHMKGIESSCIEYSMALTLNIIGKCCHLFAKNILQHSSHSKLKSCKCCSCFHIDSICDLMH